MFWNNLKRFLLAQSSVDINTVVVIVWWRYDGIQIFLLSSFSNALHSKQKFTFQFAFGLQIITERVRGSNWNSRRFNQQLYHHFLKVISLLASHHSCSSFCAALHSDIFLFLKTKNNYTFRLKSRAEWEKHHHEWFSFVPSPSYIDVNDSWSLRKASQSESFNIHFRV